MSQQNTLYNFFFDKFPKKQTLPLNDIHLVYLFFKNNTSLEAVTFLKLLTQYYIFVSNFQTNNINKITLFLLMLFKQKTLQIHLLNTNSYLGSSNFHTIGFFNNYENTILRVNNFLSKWRKLKRPLKDNVLSFESYFLPKVSEKYNTYSKLKLLQTFTNFFIVNAKKNTIIEIVNCNKQLLLAPKFSSSNIGKYLTQNSLNTFEFQFLRKNKVYNKGRYSRCRQNYRTGVYMCMYLSVVSIFGLYY